MREEAGLEVRIDAAANLIGRRPGRLSGPSLMMGSHIDTVRGGGRFDGIAGVVAALEVARQLQELNIQLHHPFEVTAFTAEEVSPFGLSCVGSRAMAGKLTAESLKLKDNGGRTLAEGLVELGGDPGKLDEAVRSGKNLSAFFELHIEQGAVLESAGMPLGVVTGIVGIYRGHIIARGRVDHAGTTPMESRRDALCAAAEAVLAFEAICRKAEGVVGTIGQLDVFPNMGNVVPGQVDLVAEIRSTDTDSLEQASSLFQEELKKIQARRQNLSLEGHLPSSLDFFKFFLEQASSLFQEELKKIQARRQVTFEGEILPSSSPVRFSDGIVEVVGGVCPRPGTGLPGDALGRRA